jgi:hypothetical protein
MGRGYTAISFLSNAEMKYGCKIKKKTNELKEEKKEIRYTVITFNNSIRLLCGTCFAQALRGSVQHFWYTADDERSKKNDEVENRGGRWGGRDCVLNKTS